MEVNMLACVKNCTIIFTIIQEYFEEASNCLNNNLIKLCFASSDAELSKMHNAYPAMFLVGASIAALLKQEGY